MADYDVVVVGSGAGGGVVAWVLASRGMTVGLIEKGRDAGPNLGLLGNDEIKRRRYYAFHDPLIEPRTFREGDEAEADRREFQGLGVCVGGGTVHYDADSPRIQQTDMALLSERGAVDGADVVDWPLDYAEIEPYYDAVEDAIGVQGEDGGDPFAEQRRPFVMPPGYPSKAGLVLSEGARRLGYHPHAMPMAINSMGYRGRPACVNCGYCNAGCPVGAKGSTAVTVIPAAVATGLCDVLSETTAIRVETSGRRATGVVVLDPTGAEARVTADHVVLATNAIETPRLLVASSTGDWPNGLGNSSGLVGRYLMFHMVFAAIGRFDEEIRSYRGRVITHAMADFTSLEGAEADVRGGYVELGGSIHPVEVGTRFPWLLHRELMTDGGWWRRIAGVTMIGEDVPVVTNRVDLDPGTRDVYGRPVARVTYARHPHDQAVVDTYLPKLAQIATEAGAAEVRLQDFAREDGVPDTKHLLGTTRMGDDPATSVCDRWGRMHDLDNVWIADGGLFPTSTAFNPTLTQQALAWRTAAYLADPGNVHP